MNRLLDRLFGSAAGHLSYEETRELARHDDPAVRRALAGRADIRPEILYYLAEDDNPDVRRRIAANRATPRQADHLLAGDRDEAVRGDLAAKIARLAPGLSANETGQIERLTYEILETLARDQAARVRRVIAETLKDVIDAPPEVIRRLAGDDLLEVCGPVLEFSPVLTDDDLLEIIRRAPTRGALGAMARRRRVSPDVSSALFATGDVVSVAELLANPTAQIREETLDAIIERARDVEAWQEPLVERPQLSPEAVRRLAGFVATRFLDALARRRELDPDTTAAVRAEVERRLNEDGEDDLWTPPDVIHLERAERMHKSGDLTGEQIARALTEERAFGEVALAVRAGLRPTVVREILRGGNPKAVVAVAWKADLGGRFAEHLQETVAGMAPEICLRAIGGGGYPLTEGDMEWALGGFA